MYDFELVCSKCLIHDDFFKAGSCPKCGGTDRTRYRELGWTNRWTACNLKEKWERKEVHKYVLKMSVFSYIVLAIALIILFKWGM